MTECDSSLWQKPPKRLALATVLLDAKDPLTAVQLGELVKTHQSNVTSLMRDLTNAGLVTRRPVSVSKATSGPRPSAFLLSDEQRELARSALVTPPAEPARARPRTTRQADSPKQLRPRAGGGSAAARASGLQGGPTRGGANVRPAGHLTQGQELVFIDIRWGLLGDVLQTLADAAIQAERAAWTAICGEELIFVFDDAGAATELLSVLNGARIPVRRSTATHIVPVADLISEARRTAPHVRRARFSRAAHDSD